ncbi:hypothetical protein TrLO_g4576 [Triparma laevis f. longispina]|uniref:Uncharacterized protein n=1 Tax=Triparma laevis f. longispina TaxID=1714387 RepID=A0A9W7FUX3_9STRA|nr:hypothetical protein TrLO_g4576 [Triparma laevis f. longispina]
MSNLHPLLPLLFTTFISPLPDYTPPPPSLPLLLNLLTTDKPVGYSIDVNRCRSWIDSFISSNNVLVLEDRFKPENIESSDFDDGKTNLF